MREIWEIGEDGKGIREEKRLCASLLPNFWVFGRLLNIPMATKRTYQPKKKRRARVHGFLKRMSTRDGREVLARRRAKGRHQVAIKTGRRVKSKR